MSGSFRKPFLNLKSTGEFQKINLSDKQAKITAHWVAQLHISIFSGTLVF